MGIVKCLRLRKRADHFPSTCKKMVINDGSTTIIITHRNEMYFPLLKTSSKYANEIFSQFAIARAQKGEIKKL